MMGGSSKWLGTRQRGRGWGSVVPATDLCRFLFFRFLWLLWWLPVEVEEAAFWGFTPCTDPSRSSGSSWLGSFSWLWKSGEVSLSVPLPGSPGGKKHKAPKASSVLLRQFVHQSGKEISSTKIYGTTLKDHIVQLTGRYIQSKHQSYQSAEKLVIWNSVTRGNRSKDSWETGPHKTTLLHSSYWNTEYTNGINNYTRSTIKNIT